MNIYIKEAKYEEALGEIEAYLKEEPQAPQSSTAARMRNQLRAQLPVKNTD